MERTPFADPIARVQFKRAATAITFVALVILFFTVGSRGPRSAKTIITLITLMLLFVAFLFPISGPVLSLKLYQSGRTWPGRMEIYEWTITAIQDAS